MQSKEVILKKIGQNIAEIRQSKGLTQIALGDILDIERQSINRIEKGRTNISIFLLLQIANALDISPKEIIKI